MLRRVSLGWLVPLLLLCGCSATALPPAEWVRTEGVAGDLERDREACTARAEAAVESIPEDRRAADVMINSFLSCMQERGWRLDEKDDHDDDD